MQISSLIFRGYAKIIRYSIAHSYNKRPSSAPYISGDSFRSLADHIYDDQKTFDPSVVKEKNIIFVKSDLVEEYFAKIHPHIQAPYILITHNSDRNIIRSDIKYIDDKIIQWFAMSVLVAHPKITPLPAALENKKYAWATLPFLSKKIQKLARSEKIDRIFYSFTDATNPAERTHARSILQKSSVADTVPWLIPPEYVKTVSGYKFQACPFGNSAESHRLWETLYLRTVPIVRRSVHMEYFKNLGLPIWIIDDWQELSMMNENMLAQKYTEIMMTANFKAITFDFWKKQIVAYQL